MSQHQWTTPTDSRRIEAFTAAMLKKHQFRRCLVCGIRQLRSGTRLGVKNLIVTTGSRDYTAEQTRQLDIHIKWDSWKYDSSQHSYPNYGRGDCKLMIIHRVLDE